MACGRLPLSSRACRHARSVGLAEPVPRVRDREAPVRLRRDPEPVRGRMSGGIAPAATGSRSSRGRSGARRGTRSLRRCGSRRRPSAARRLRRRRASGSRRRRSTRATTRTGAARRRGQHAGDRRHVLDVRDVQPRGVLFEQPVVRPVHLPEPLEPRRREDRRHRTGRARPCGYRSAPARRAAGARARTDANPTRSPHDCSRSRDRPSRSDCSDRSTRAPWSATCRRNRRRGTGPG